MHWVNNALRGSRYPFGGDRHKQRLVILALAILLIAITVVYYVFFRVYDVGVRMVAVNGENVEQVDGFTVHSTTWLSRPQMERFLERIHASGASLPSTIKTYRGVPYIRAIDLVSSLNHYGDRSQFTGGRLLVALMSNQHYSYQANGDRVLQQEIMVNGHSAGRVLAVYHEEATYMSAGAISDVFAKAGLPSSWDGKALDLMLGGKASPAPIQDPAAYSVIAFGAGKAMYAPDYVWQHQTYLPAYSLSAALEQLGWTSSFEPWKWALTSQAGANTGNTGENPGANQTSSDTTAYRTVGFRKPVVLAFVPFYFGDLAAFEDVMHHQASYNALAADTWTVAVSGSLNGSAPAGTASQAAVAGNAVYAMVTNLSSNGFDAQEMTSILGNPSRSNRLREEITSLVDSEGFDGATLDFESIPPADRMFYSDFVSSLAADLHSEGKQLEVVVPPDTGSDNEPWNGAYDQAKLGEAADFVVVMAYDYSYIGGPAGPIAPLPWVQQTLAYTVSRVPANKVLLGIDAYGYDWTGKHTIAVGLTNVHSFLTAHHIHPSWDTIAEAPWFKWTDTQGEVHTVYYENGKSTAAKLDLTQSYGIAGVALWRAGLEDNAVLRVLSQYAKRKHP